MDNLQLRFVFDRKRQATDTKKALLQIEVRVQRTSQKVFISTGIHLFKNQFSERNGFTCRNHNNAALITGKATRIFRQIEAFCLSDKCKSISDVKNWNKENADEYSVVGFMRSQLSKSDPPRATFEHHIALIKKIEDFGKIKTFSDLTISNIFDFDLYLKNNGVKAPATLNKRHNAFRSYIKIAIYHDLCKKDPYFEFKMPSKKSKDPTYLEEVEIQQIINWKPVNEKLEKVKDLFILQCFTGLAYIDICGFDKATLKEISGVKILDGKRIKTGIRFTTVLLNEAKTILKKYDYELPIITNQKYNDYLKLLGAGVGIKKQLTTHVARHTFATYLLNKDVPIKTVSRAMGHSSVRMTEHYAQLLGKKVIKDMERLLTTQSSI
jgi:Site-specific recombinase XerD